MDDRQVQLAGRFFWRCSAGDGDISRNYCRFAVFLARQVTRVGRGNGLRSARLCEPRAFLVPKLPRLREGNWALVLVLLWERWKC